MSSTTRLSRQDAADMQAINSAIDRMRTFTPPDPYVLTIPQDEPKYHHHYQFQAEQWLHGTPFEPREHESTQYQTFVYHDPARSVFMQFNSRVVEGRGVNGSAKGRDTGANTPAGGDKPKKTMSLGAYKKKIAGGTPETAATKEAEQQQSKKSAVKGPVERLKADEEVLAAVEDSEDVLPATSEVEVKKDLKRKRGDGALNEAFTSQDHEEQQVTESTAGDEQATKKVRRKSPSPKEEKGQSRQEAQPAKSPEKAQENNDTSMKDLSLPPKLSPPPTASDELDLPPKLSPPPQLPPDDDDEPFVLPPKLSPTIPANIQAALDARQAALDARSTHRRSVSRSSDVEGPRTASKEAPSRPFTPPTKSVPRNAFRANSSSPAVRSDTEDRGRLVTSMPPQPRQPTVETTDDEIPVGKRAESVKKQRESLAEKKNLVVKIKFKKAQREAVRRILKLKPNPAQTLLPAIDDTAEKSTDDEKVRTRPRNASDARQRGRRDTNTKGVAKPVGPPTKANGVTKQEKESTSPRKRPRAQDTEEEEDYPPKKRKNTAEPTKPPQQTSTPIPSDRLSPTSAQKHSTPTTTLKKSKDVVSEAMRRERSHESNHPTPSSLSHHSPSVNGSALAKPSPSSNPSAPKTTKQREWDTEQKRLEALGKQLKHIAQDHLNNAKASITDSNLGSRERKLAAVISLECLLAYMLAFTCAEEAAAAADPKVPLSSTTRLWRSLNGFFGFVKAQCTPHPPLRGLACWLGVVFNAHLLSLLSQDEKVPTREALLEAQNPMLRAAAEAEKGLDVDALIAAFPKAWEARAKGVFGEGERLESVEKGFAGAYKLPLGLQTTPLRAVRAGMAMLGEWIDGEGGKELYELKLKL